MTGTARDWPRLREGYRFRWRCALTVLEARDPERSIDGLFARAERLTTTRPCSLADALDEVDRRLAEAAGAYVAHTRSGQSLYAVRWSHVRPPASQEPSGPPQLVCSGSLGGLARWLRVAGLRADFRGAGVQAAALIAECVMGRRILLTSDTLVLRQGTVRDGGVLLLWLPSTRTPPQQMQIVLRDLGLAPTDPRCMACGGELAAVTREAVLDALPPRTAQWRSSYWQCCVCGRLFWQGTHWDRIRRELAQAERAKASPRSA